ncbi:transcription termination factor 1 isoform X2 [Caloenas nicobarica]|uniref:transcription termination factor 1 isoform X2 n=1 Tax=Caloenas nicobarica TaxID=187106 RepID=UPI0032B75DB6
MTEEASADDIQVQDFLKKKKKKKKIHKEHNEKHENYERESVQNEELSCTSPVLLEDRAAQSGEGCKKKKKHKNKGEEQHPSLGNSCVELEHDISDETGVDTSQKKKKKKKHKCHDSTDQQSDITCVTVNQHLIDCCQEINADYVYEKQSAKKKRKEKSPEGDEVYERSTSETCDKNDNERSKKKKKKKKRERNTEDMQEDTAVTIDQSLLSPKKKKKRKDKDLPLPAEEVDVAAPQHCHGDGDCDSSPAVCEDSPDVPANFSKLSKAADQSHQKTSVCTKKEDTAVTVDQSLLSTPKKKKKRKKKDRVLLLSTEEVDVATPQQCHEDGDCDAFPAIHEDSPDVPANFSKLTKAADQSHRKTSVCTKKEDTALTIDQSLLSSPKKKKKRKKKDRVLLLSTEEVDVATPQQCHEDGDCDAFPAIHEDSPDVPANFSKLTKAADRSHRKTPEDTDVSIEQSLLSTPKKKREKKGRVLSLPTEEFVVAAPQQCHEDDDCDASLVREDSLDVPANFSKLTKAADQSHRKTSQEDTAVSIEQSLLSTPKKKKKRKDKVLPLPAEVVDVATPQQCHGDCDSSPPVCEDSPDVPANFSKLNKAADRSHRKTLEDTAATVGQSLLSPKQKKKKKDRVLALPTEEVGVAAPQQCHEDGDCDSSPAVQEDSPDVPANFSKPNKAARRSHRKTPARTKKVVKSRAFVMEESSSESDEMTTELLASNRKKDRNSSFTETVTSEELGPNDKEHVGSRTRSAMDLEAAKQELEEFIPHVRSIAECSIRKMAGKDLARFKQFKEQGIAVRFGKFSQKENDQIRKNIEEFLSITGIDSAEKLLFTSRYPEEQKNINYLKAKHHFCDKLSEGIPRPWRLVYYRAKKIFDPNNYKGRYTKAEKEELKKYHALHGNDWKKISEMMSRSSLSVAMKYSQIKSAVNYGRWSKEEIRKLMHAVEEVIRKRVGMEDANSRSSSEKSGTDHLIDQETLYQKLPWTEIETKVGTRHWRQCKQKWMIILTNKMTKGQPSYRGTKAIQAKISLIKRLHEMQVEDYSEVKWEELTDIIGNVPAGYIQSKFYRLKVTSVPFWQKKTFSEIIDYLYEKKLPELEEMLESRKGKPNSSDNSTATNQKKAFRLREIFDSGEDSD